MGMKINLVTLCSGMEAQGQALKRLCTDCPELEWDLLAWSEIEPNAIKAHNAIFPEYADRNLGDMTTCDYSVIKDKVDMLFYSTPCQSVSCAGQRKGMKEGDDAASSLIWHTKRAIKELKPKIAVLENVKGMIMGANAKEFHKWQHEMESYGYTNFCQVMDARDYGVAQHRERLFMVSILDCDEPFYFPKPFKLKKRLKDYLEDNVPESYYLKPEQVARIVAHCDKKQAEGCGFKTQFSTKDEIAATITSKYGSRETDPYVKEKTVGISIHPLNRKMEFNGYRSVRCDVAPTLTAHDGKGGEPCVWEVEPTIQSFGSYVPSSACGGKIVKADGIAPTVMENHGNVTAVADPQIIQLFQLYPDSDNTQVGRVYDINGISTTLSTACGGHHEPKILTQVRTEEANELRRKGIEVFANRQLVPREDDCSNTITTVTKDNLVQEPVACAVRGRDSESGVTKQKLEIGDTTANCITSVQKDSMVAEPAADTIIASYPPNVSEKTQIANDIPDPSVWVDPETNKAYYYKDGWLWRIRKLMPTECLRLMDVSEEDIEKIRNCGISKPAIYSLAGNSVVVNVLYHIFHKLFVDKSNPNQQLTLF